MSKQTCTQHGCEYDADEPAEVCPVCNNPQSGAGDSEPSWDDLFKDELIAQCDDWGLAYSKSFTRAELIETLEAAELEAKDGHD